MKVLLVNVVCGTGSTGRICSDLVTCLNEKGHEGCVAYGRGQAPGGIPAYRIEKDAGVRLHALKARFLDGAGRGSKAATRRFVRWIEQEGFDLIHLHNLHGYYLNVGVLFDYLKESGLPVVWTLHDCWPFTGHCTHFEWAQCEKWRTGCYACPEKHRYPASFLLDRSRQNYAFKKEKFTALPSMHIVTPSRWLKDLAEQSFLKELPIEVIPNGIDRAAFRPIGGDLKARWGLDHKRVYLAVASRWDERKGLSDLIRLSRLLNDREKLVIVGVDKAQRRALPDSVLSVERTDSIEELAQLYSMADVLLNPTWEDTYPTVNIEAQACGTRVVTYQTGGSPETLMPGGGRVSEKKTPASLLEAARNLPGKENAAYAFPVLSRQQAAERYVALYERVCKEAKA